MFSIVLAAYVSKYYLACRVLLIRFEGILKNVGMLLKSAMILGIWTTANMQ